MLSFFKLQFYLFGQGFAIENRYCREAATVVRKSIVLFSGQNHTRLFRATWKF